MNFVHYKNLSGRSNVEAYSIGPSYIVVKFFNTQKHYTYSFRSAGERNVNKLICLSVSGYGLNRFININCKYLYER